MLREVATQRRSYRLFDLLIPAPELLGLVDPLPLIFWKSLQVQLQTASAQVSVYSLNENSNKRAGTFKAKLWGAVYTKEGLQAARGAVFSAAGKLPKPL